MKFSVFRLRVPAMLSNESIGASNIQRGDAGEFDCEMARIPLLHCRRKSILTTYDEKTAVGRGIE
jgi:hypothetical protein